MDNNQIIFYSTPDGNIKVEVIFDEDTFWLTQKAMAKLFGVEVPGISKHLSRIFESGELQEESTVSILERVQKEGKRDVKREVEYYRILQDQTYESDFDREIKKIKKQKT